MVLIPAKDSSVEELLVCMSLFVVVTLSGVEIVLSVDLFVDADDSTKNKTVF